MGKICMTILVAVLLFSSCKKEEQECTNDCGTVTTHYAYVRGVVVDSITGLPLPNAIVYSAYNVFSSGDSSGPGSDTTDVNGEYYRRIVWYVGRSYSAGLLSRPEDSTDLYINSYSINSCNFLKIKWGQLIEDDTIILPAISSKPYAYVSTHIKEVLPVSFGVTVYWDPAIIGRISAAYPASADTVVIRQICPNLKTYVYRSGSSDSVTVNSGDTAFVDVFY